MDTQEITTILGRGSSFEGKLTFEGTVRIDGRFAGEIKTDGTLIIGESAQVEANIQAAIVVVPRLVAGLTGGTEQPPLGPAWDDTWLLLPAEERGRTYRQQFTGETFVVVERDGRAGLPMPAVLGTFPLALLERMTAGQDGAAPAR